MYHTILRNLRKAGMSQSTNSASESEYSSITDSAACDSAESAGSERNVRGRSHSREGNHTTGHSKRKSVGFESNGGSDSSEHAAASLPSSPAPEPAAKRRNLTQSMGGNPAAVMQAKAAKEAMARHAQHTSHHEKKKSGDHVTDPLRHSHSPNGPNVPNGTTAHEEPTTRRRGNTVVAGADFDDFVPRAVTSVDPELVKKMRRRSDKPVSKKREEKEPKEKDVKDKKDKKDKKTKIKKEKFEAVEEEITIADLPAKKEKKDDKKKDRRKSDSSSRHKGDIKKEKEEKKTVGGKF